VNPSNPPLAPALIREENHYARYAPFLLLLLITLGFRIIQLDADPPSDFSWSGGYFADEGFWSHNARNAALFGNPVQDDWDARIVSPVFARIQQLIFALFGAGFIQVRLIGVISSLLIAATSFLLIRSQFDQQSSFFFSILVSLNYPMMVLGRQGILDPFAAALCLLALMLALRGSILSSLVAGSLFVACCVTKYLMIYAAVPFLFIVWNSKKYVPFLTGVGITALVWFFLSYLPHKELLSGYSAYYASQQSWEIGAVLKNILLQPFYLYFVKTPAILCLGNLALWFWLVRFKTSGTVEKVCFLWLLSGILFFALWNYRPFRYYTSLIPPLAAMAGFMLLQFKDVVDIIRSTRFRGLIYFGILLPALQMWIVLMDRIAHWNIVPEQLGIHSVDAALLILLSGILIWALRAGREKQKYLAWAFVAVFLLSDLRNYLTWMLKPEYNAVQISKDLENRAPQGVLTGQWAPELCLGNKLRAIPVWEGFVNSTKPFQRFGITHILQWKYPLGGEKFEQWYPDDFQHFHYVTKYRIKDSDLILYERKRED
jgi:4-amino-4-deoxy-L-arabinose transferase-like glycosyltransferase